MKNLRNQECARWRDQELTKSRMCEMEKSRTYEIKNVQDGEIKNVRDGELTGIAGDLSERERAAVEMMNDRKEGEEWSRDDGCKEAGKVLC